jgi:hypothetical protein
MDLTYTERVDSLERNRFHLTRNHRRISGLQV